MDPSNPLLIQKKRTKQELKRSIRIAVAKLRECEKEAIMEATSNNMEMFHKLIQRNRKKGNEFIQDLSMNSITYSGQNEVIQGIKEHFSKLATLDKNQLHRNKYHQLVEKEIVYINEMTKNQPIQPITEKELKDAINSINRRKSADYYNITIDHFLYSEDQIISILLLLINNIFRTGEIPDSLKIGLLSPIYKNKGSKHDATNYRGITVLPVLSKIIESIIKVRIQPNIQNMQNTSQRGFTKGASPRNAALPVEEAYGTFADEKNNGYLVLLDAKAAFDKVVHSHLFRRIYQAGIQNKTWSLISNLHQ
jgi:hypothetical protein